MQKIGRYEIRGKLGKGAMGGVLRAYDPQVRREVAVKILHRHYSDDNKARTRFLRELSTVAQLNHHAIVPIVDSGIDAGRAYLVMELMEGGSLADRLRQSQEPLSAEEIKQVIERIGSALDAVHEKHLIHRDVKPENILYDAAGDPYLSDFGIVRLGEVGAKLTTVDTVIGTPAYMSPEQASGAQTIDGRSDLYSLGIVLFEMLTGDVPYIGDEERGTAVKHIIDDIPNICKRNERLPRQWRRLNEKALAKKPEARFSSGAELTKAVEKAFESRGLLNRQQRWLYGIAGGILLLLIAFGLAMQFSAESISAAPPSTATNIATESAESPSPTSVAVQKVPTITRRAPTEIGFIDCTEAQNYGFLTSAPILDPPAGTEISSGSTIVPKAAFPIEITGNCPIKVARLISLNGGLNYNPILQNAAGDEVVMLEPGERGQVVLAFDSVGEVTGIDDEWQMIVSDFDGFEINFPAEQEPEPLQLIGKDWLDIATPHTTETSIAATATKIFVGTETAEAQATNTSVFELTQTAQAQANATQTVQAQATNARNFQATQTAEAQATNTSAFELTQTAQAQSPTATVAPEFACGDVRGNPNGDFDNDRKLNGEELNEGLNPCNPDTDGDSVQDGFDIAPFDPNRPNNNNNATPTP